MEIARRLSSNIDWRSGFLDIDRLYLQFSLDVIISFLCMVWCHNGLFSYLFHSLRTGYLDLSGDVSNDVFLQNSTFCLCIYGYPAQLSDPQVRSKTQISGARLRGNLSHSLTAISAIYWPR